MEKGKLKPVEMLAAAILLLMTLLAFFNVVSRYLFHMSISATEELTTNLFGLLTFLGAAIAIKRKTHLGLTIITDHLSPKMVKGLEITGHIIGIALFIFMMVESTKMVWKEYTSGHVSAGLQWPQWIYGAIIPIGCFILIITYTSQIVKIIKRREPEVTQ